LYSVPRHLFRGTLRHSFHSGARTVAVCLAASAVLAVAGCGNNYRPVVSAINPVGPATQPPVYATAVSDPGNGRNGLVTVVDVFGDTIIANVSIAPAPSYLATDPLGESYVLHSNSVLVESFDSAPGLNTGSNLVRQSSLSAGANPTQIYPSSGTSSPMFITEPGLSKVAVLTAGAPPTARQELPVPPNPVYTVGLAAAPRVYTLSQGATPGTSIGTATAVENGANNTISGSIPVGISPVFGIMTADTRRTFVLNGKGNGAGVGTVSVIDTTGNKIDTTVTVGANPIWADIAPAINELAVVNSGNGTTAGSLTVVNIALCSASTIAGNAQCDPNNPVDSADFGKILATIPVGVAPVQVAVLTDLSKAYVANSGDGTVTVIDLTTMVATKTIKVGGTLNWIAAVAGSPTGKVLVTAQDTQTLTIIRTDIDAIDATLSLQGNSRGMRVAQ
jgi:YVTN family beta-propeller protein